VDHYSFSSRREFFSKRPIGRECEERLLLAEIGLVQFGTLLILERTRQTGFAGMNLHPNDSAEKQDDQYKNRDDCAYIHGDFSSIV